MSCRSASCSCLSPPGLVRREHPCRGARSGDAPAAAGERRDQGSPHGRPRPTVAEPLRLGRAAVLAILRVARHCAGAVLDSTWLDYAIPKARTLPGRLVDVRCIVPAE